LPMTPAQLAQFADAFEHHERDIAQALPRKTAPGSGWRGPVAKPMTAAGSFRCGRA
jgi:hypothetical protein